MADQAARADTAGNDERLRWDDLRLTLNFNYRQTGQRRLALFVPDELMYCYVNLWYYLRGDASWEEFVRCLPLIVESDRDVLN